MSALLTEPAKAAILPPMRAFASLACLLLATTPAQAAKFQFCWIGNSGYTMRGSISFPDALLGSGIITQDDVTGFSIYGFLDNFPIGSWTLDQRTTQTTWELYFDTTALEFPMGGIALDQSYQAWNANGDVNDCGAGGFGFNGGNWAQDVCIDNLWIEDSSITPDTPLPAYPEGVAVHCEAVLNLS